MNNRTPSELYELVQCMSKAEKRSFSMQTNSKKLLALFGTVNNQKAFPDKQAHNLKPVLYQKLLSCFKPNEVERKLHEGMKQAKLLYEKRLFLQSYKALSKVKLLAMTYHQVSFRFQAVALEKKIRVTHVIANSNSDINRIKLESDEILREISAISHHSLQSLLLYEHFAYWGTLLPVPHVDLNVPASGFYSLMYKLQAALYAAMIRGDDHSKSLAELFTFFEGQPRMKIYEQIQFEKAGYYLETKVSQPHTPLKDDPNEIARFFIWAKHLVFKEEYSKALNYLIPIVNAKLSFRVDLQIKARELHIDCHKALNNHDIIDSLERSLKRFEKKLQSLSFAQ